MYTPDLHAPCGVQDDAGAKPTGAWSQLNVTLHAPAGDLREAAWPLFDALGRWLDASNTSGDLQGWFVRKSPGLRLRLRGADPLALEQLTAQLDSAPVVTRWGFSTYEPELPRLGGPVALELVHTLLARHTELWIEQARAARAGQTRLGPGFMAQLHYQELLMQSLRAPEEAWDVWFTLTRIYSPNTTLPTTPSAAGDRGESSVLAKLPQLASATDHSLLEHGRQLAAAFGDGLREAHDACALWGGRRALLATLASFLFNLWGLSPDAIATLCRLSLRELDPRPCVPPRDVKVAQHHATR